MDTTPFIDRLDSAITNANSILVAGIDPRIDDLPGFIVSKALAANRSFDEQVEYALCHYFERVIGLLAGQIACIKPNLAFFEQYGIGGLKAFTTFMRLAQQAKLLTIADAKRGDIGSTAQAYSSAFLGQVSAFGSSHTIFNADALTVNPYLGFDTLEEFIRDCRTFGKGLFILVKTSNKGSADLQNLRTSSGSSQVYEHVARFISSHASELTGTATNESSGLSGLGAVVGATYPEEARALRALMPHSIFLIPGYGAQGASAADALAGFAPGLESKASPRGGLVNSSRGLFSIPNPKDLTAETFDAEVLARIKKANQELNAARADIGSLPAIPLQNQQNPSEQRG